MARHGTYEGSKLDAEHTKIWQSMKVLQVLTQTQKLKPRPSAAVGNSLISNKRLSNSLNYPSSQFPQNIFGVVNFSNKKLQGTDSRPMKSAEK